MRDQIKSMLTPSPFTNLHSSLPFPPFTECEKDGRIYGNGQKIEDSNNPCEICYCQGGEIVCAVIDCYWRSDCQPRYIENRCCPLYDHCAPSGHVGPFLRRTTTTAPTTTTAATTTTEIAWGNLSSAVYDLSTTTTTATPIPILFFQQGEEAHEPIRVEENEISNHHKIQTSVLTSSQELAAEEEEASSTTTSTTTTTPEPTTTTTTTTTTSPVPITAAVEEEVEEVTEASSTTTTAATTTTTTEAPATTVEPQPIDDAVHMEPEKDLPPTEQPEQEERRTTTTPPEAPVTSQQEDGEGEIETKELVPTTTELAPKEEEEEEVVVEDEAVTTTPLPQPHPQPTEEVRGEEESDLLVPTTTTKSETGKEEEEHYETTPLAVVNDDVGVEGEETRTTTSQPLPQEKEEEVREVTTMTPEAEVVSSTSPAPAPEEKPIGEKEEGGAGEVPSDDAVQIHAEVGANSIQEEEVEGVVEGTKGEVTKHEGEDLLVPPPIQDNALIPEIQAQMRPASEGGVSKGQEEDTVEVSALSKQEEEAEEEVRTTTTPTATPTQEQEASPTTTQAPERLRADDPFQSSEEEAEFEGASRVVFEDPPAPPHTTTAPEVSFRDEDEEAATTIPSSHKNESRPEGRRGEGEEGTTPTLGALDSLFEANLLTREDEGEEVRTTTLATSGGRVEEGLIPVRGIPSTFDDVPTPSSGELGRSEILGMGERDSSSWLEQTALKQRRRDLGGGEEEEGEEKRRRNSRLSRGF